MTGEVPAGVDVAAGALRPACAGDAAEASRLLRERGACVLSWKDHHKTAVIDACEAVLGGRLCAHWEPRTLRPHDEPGRPRRIVRAQRLILEPTEPAEPGGGPVRVAAGAVQTEGLGAALPDVVAYLAAQEPESGGESRLVDGHGLLAALARSSAGQRLHDALWQVPVRIRTHPQQPPEQRPLARRTPGGRVVVSYLPAALLTDRDTAFAAQWHALVRAAAEVAPRVRLRPGEVLLVDNYRAYHGRDGYRGPRVMHRAWCWTDTVLAYPMRTDEQASDAP